MADPLQASARAARLATALRANLARRKARDRAAPVIPDETVDPPAVAGKPDA